MAKTSKDILIQLSAVIKDLSALSRKQNLTQVERIMISRLKKKLDYLKNELDSYINPVIYKVSFYNSGSKYTTYFSNIPKELVPICLSIKYPKYKDIKILEIRELGKF